MIYVDRKELSPGRSLNNINKVPNRIRYLQYGFFDRPSVKNADTICKQSSPL